MIGRNAINNGRKRPSHSWKRSPTNNTIHARNIVDHSCETGGSHYHKKC